MKLTFAKVLARKLYQEVVRYLTLCQLAATCHLLITFRISLEPDQALHFVRPDLDPNCLTS